MEVEKIVTGSLDENCYVIKKNDTCLVVDPGDDYDKIKEKIGSAKTLAVLVTHSHFDHVGALRNFLNKIVNQIEEYDGENWLDKQPERSE